MDLETVQELAETLHETFDRVMLLLFRFSFLRLPSSHIHMVAMEDVEVVVMITIVLVLVIVRPLHLIFFIVPERKPRSLSEPDHSSPDLRLFFVAKHWFERLRLLSVDDHIVTVRYFPAKGTRTPRLELRVSMAATVTMTER